MAARLHQAPKSTPYACMHPNPKQNWWPGEHAGALRRICERDRAGVGGTGPLTRQVWRVCVCGVCVVCGGGDRVAGWVGVGECGWVGTLVAGVVLAWGGGEHGREFL